MDDNLATRPDGIPGTGTPPAPERRGLTLLPEQYRRLHETAPVGYFIIGADNAILDVNISGARLLGSTREELLGSGLAAFLSAPCQGDFHALMKRILEIKEWQQAELELVTADGAKFSALIQGRQILSPEKAVLLVTDVTAVKVSEENLRESEKKYRDVADLLAEGIFETELNGSLAYANNRIIDSFGLDPDDLKNRTNIFTFVAPQSRDLAKERFARIIKHEDLGPVEYVLQRKDGTTFPGLVHSLAIVRDGDVVGIRGVVFDISERKRAEEALRDSERRYRELTEQLEEGVFEIDVRGTVTYANRKGLAALGLEENDLKNGFSVFDIIVPQELDGARERFARVLKGEDIGIVEYVLQRKDGTTFPALTHSSVIAQGGVVAGVRGVMVDISELKRTEQALRESEQRFRTLIKSLHEGIWVLDKDDLTTFINPRMAEMLGYAEEEMLGKPVYSFSAAGWRQTTADYMARRKQGISEQIEAELLRKDGERICALLETSPILDAEGRYTGSIAGVQDITERKRAEEQLRQTMAELDRSNKELEQFAYVASHDLREPLRMMTSFSQSLERRFKGQLDQTADEYIHFIVDGAARMQRLIDDILIFSRVTTRALPFEPVAMERIIQDVLVNLSASIEETKATVTHEELPVIQADPSQMMQVMQNLIGNAVKFHREDEPPVVHVSARREGQGWVFSVKDNGIGIDPELFGRLFTLFQRLHPPDRYPGTGVGLAVTKKIVQRHGGRIWVESEPGRGSTFSFCLPL